MKIPTLFGLTLLIIATVLGVSIYFYTDFLNLKKKLIFTPSEIEVINLSPSQAAIVWRTNIALIGKVNFGDNPYLGKLITDDRDVPLEKPRLSHFVTIKNLKSDTTYFYKVKNENFEYPEKVQSFKTTPQLVTDIQSGNQPIIGTVVDQNLEPSSDTLIILNLDQTAKMGTYTNNVGNFILPLKDFYSKDLKSLFLIKDRVSASLELSKGDTHSTVDITLPLPNQDLSSLPLGRNINLRDYLAIAQSSKSKIANSIFDLNSDGKVNSVDLSILLDNLEKKIKDKRADFNSDGVIDQKDIDLLQQAIK